MQTTKFSSKEEHLSECLLFTNWHCVAHFRIIYGWELNILTSEAWGYCIIVRIYPNSDDSSHYWILVMVNMTAVMCQPRGRFQCFLILRDFWSPSELKFSTEFHAGKCKRDHTQKYKGIFSSNRPLYLPLQHWLFYNSKIATWK